jgi:protein TonB
VNAVKSRSLLVFTILISLALHAVLLWLASALVRPAPHAVPLEVELMALPATREAPPPALPRTPTQKTSSKGNKVASPGVRVKSQDISVQNPQAKTTEPNSSDDLRAATLLKAGREATKDSSIHTRNIVPHDRNLIFAAYEEAYRRKVENVGSVNYPPPVNGKPLSGAVRMRALIGADGRLLEVTVEGSSGVADLDRAARQIVQMAAPFQAFTEAMKADAQRVTITCTFRFTTLNNGVSSAP